MSPDTDLWLLFGHNYEKRREVACLMKCHYNTVTLCRTTTGGGGHSLCLAGLRSMSLYILSSISSPRSVVFRCLFMMNGDDSTVTILTPVKPRAFLFFINAG